MELTILNSFCGNLAESFIFVRKVILKIQNLGLKIYILAENVLQF